MSKYRMKMSSLVSSFVISFSADADADTDERKERRERVTYLEISWHKKGHELGFSYNERLHTYCLLCAR